MVVSIVQAERPEMTLRQSLMWDYFFENGWVCVATDEGCYVVMDERFELNHAQIFPDKAALLEWLDSAADEQISDDPMGFFGAFFNIPARYYSELLTEEVIDAMIRVVNNNKEN